MKKIVIVSVSFLLTGQLIYAKGMADIRASLANIVDQAYHHQANQNYLIKLAARNKMLSQKMAKEAVMMAYGNDKAAHHARLMETAREFDTTIEGLQKGDSVHHITAVTDPKARQNLHEVATEWQAFYGHLKSGQPEDVAYIISHNEKLLRLSHKLTQTLKSEMVISATLNKVVEHTLKIADRQRMLTQKMLKEKLLIYYGINPKRNEIRLKGSIILFENGLKGLLEGEKRRGLVKITNKKVHTKLDEIWHLWEEVAPIYRKAHISAEELALLEKIEPKLLKKSDEVVTLVENSLEL